MLPTPAPIEPPHQDLATLKHDLLVTYTPNGFAAETRELIWTLAIEGVDVSARRDATELHAEVEEAMRKLTTMAELAFWDGHAWGEDHRF